LNPNPGLALRNLAGQWVQDRGDQVGARLRPGTKWFVTTQIGPQQIPPFSSTITLAVNNVARYYSL
jgi:hypothetical protein